MQSVEINLNENEIYIFRELIESDNKKLGNFFSNLSQATISKYQPHPLTQEEALSICKSINKDFTKRFIIENTTEIIGYFLLNFNLFESEKQRYNTYGIELNPKLDPVFAPCISDKYQNKGIASKSMKYIIQYACDQKIRSIVLMGGTQEPNFLAINFYKKCGFKEYGKFYTSHNNLNNLDMKLNLTCV